MSTALQPFLDPDHLAKVRSLDARVAELKTQFAQRIVVLVQSSQIVITDTASCAAAVALRKTIGEIDSEIEAEFKPIKQYWDTNHKRVCKDESALRAKLVDKKNGKNPATLDGQLVVAIQRYVEETERRRLAEEARLRPIVIAERETAVVTHAAHLEAQGHSEMAHAALTQGLVSARTATVVLPDETKQVEGLNLRTTWKWRPIGGDTPEARQRLALGDRTQPSLLEVARRMCDAMPQVEELDELRAAIAREDAMVPRRFLTLDTKRLDDYADGMREAAIGTIPGIEFYPDRRPVR